MENIEPFNKNHQRHGYWEVYWYCLNNKGYYVNNELYGYWIELATDKRYYAR